MIIERFLHIRKRFTGVEITAASYFVEKKEPQVFCPKDSTDRLSLAAKEQPWEQSKETVYVWH